MPKISSRALYTIVLAAVCFLLAYLIGITRLAWFIQNDTLWHLKAGEYMVKHRTILTQDVFSWTMPGVHWYSHEWLWEIIFFAIYKYFGFAGLFWTNVIILALILLVSFFVVDNLPGRVLFVITAVVGWGIYGYFVARPHTLAALLFTVTLLIVRQDKLNTKQLIALFLIFVLWANIHSSVVLGVFLVGLFAVLEAVETKKYDEAIKSAAVVTAASLISPHHVGTYYFFFKLTTAKLLTDNIAEWRSPNFHDTLLLVTVLAWIVAFIISTRRERKLRNTLPVFLIGLAMILSAIRNIVLVGLLFGIACQTKNKEKHEEKWLSVFAFVLVATFMLSININNLKPVDEKTMLNQEWAKIFKAIDFMQQHGYTDRILNDYDLGAYMIFRDIKCSIDSRADMYYFASPDYTKQYFDCLQLKIPPEKFIQQKLSARYVWVGLQTPVAQYLKAKHYRVLYSDKYTILFKVPSGKKKAGL